VYELHLFGDAISLHAKRSPLRYSSFSRCGIGPRGCTKARIDMHGQRAKSSASEDSSQIVGAVRQPQSDAQAGADAGLT
jgi:hypothetical protein